MSHEIKSSTPEQTQRAKRINDLFELCLYASPGAITEIIKEINQLKLGLITPDISDTDHNSPPHES